MLAFLHKKHFKTNLRLFRGKFAPNLSEPPKKTPKNQKAFRHPQRQVANHQTSSLLRRLEQPTPRRRNANQKTKN